MRDDLEAEAKRVFESLLAVARGERLGAIATGLSQEDPTPALLLAREAAR